MTKIIKGLHFGKPGKHGDNSKGILYLTLRSFHWQVDGNTNPRMKRRGWIKPGNVIRVQDTVNGRPQNNSVYAVNEYTDEDQVAETLSLLKEQGTQIKSIISARNPHNHNRALINSTLCQMYNFYISHLHTAKELDAQQVICKKDKSGKLVFRFQK